MQIGRMHVPSSTSTGEVRYGDHLEFELSTGGELNLETLEIFVGAGSSAKEYQLCLVDCAGRICGQQDFDHGSRDLTQMAA